MSSAAMVASSARVVKLKRKILAACITCPLCHKLIRDATTISECLHSFCRKCIFSKLTDEVGDCCPICRIYLGRLPEVKLRPDHSLEDVRAKIFPYKSRKVQCSETSQSIRLPIKRKERSLSSLVVNNPGTVAQKNLTGRRTKAVGRRKPTFRAPSPVMNELNVTFPSSTETLQHVSQ